MRDIAPRAAAADINARIAARVRDLRQAQSLTLEALASRSDVSRSMLSLVERGESSPTAVLLEKIATGLGVPLAALFDDADAAPSPLSTRAERTPWKDPQSGYVRCNISPSNYASPIRIVEVRLPPGAAVAYESGPREAGIHQQIWVQEGSLEVTVDRTSYRLAADDCLAMQLDVPTAFRNRGRKSARYIVVVAAERARALRNAAP